ncbi:probable F420-dependent oxidoreductase, Rv3093c family [Saccharopolyspora antimicrobica]|uniref:F420-dependent oxidoreductase n=1 Tax=Saccharopolyspora antimicrobica TaxID=455193 RepID=A0A1I4SAX1_9PSEU|nr:LLM class F420-dependent oxidoreductase [Saccharopolyspora antimicrobica]RKT87669.1 putative F420-dependent oxidoreductase [Saccharopolyspora antimicrobica]SFM61637.1 probable F420-dependent oxidoreductase, Rv3093c family [Saccharopolyspora antimicrobica]
MQRRWGITVPFQELPLAGQRELIAELPDLGYTDVWSSEANGTDAFTPLALASAWAPRLRLGTAIVPVYTRGPATLAMSAASLAAAAPGRFALGIGTSSNVIVERWNGIPFEEPYKRVRDTLRFLRKALRGEKVTETYETFRVQGFTAGVVPDPAPPLLVAALRPGMLRLAGREGDGAILNWLSPEDVRTVVPHVHEGGAGKEVVARIFTMPDVDADTARGIARRQIAAYLNVPVYRAFHEWLGREELGPMWRAWDAGDRKAALAAIPDSVVDELVVHGPAEHCRERIQQYVDNGVTTPAIALVTPGDPADAVRALGLK